jgi:hypothetical protein
MVMKSERLLDDWTQKNIQDIRERETFLNPGDYLNLEGFLETMAHPTKGVLNPEMKEKLVGLKKPNGMKATRGRIGENQKEETMEGLGEE